MFITIYLFKKTSLLNKLISFFLLTIDSVGILISPYYNRFLDSFSVSNSDYGAGTMVQGLWFGLLGENTTMKCGLKRCI